METYVTEEQQLEAIKKWFKKYGDRLAWVIIIVLSIFLAVSYWRHHSEVIRERASEEYMALMGALGSKDETTTLSRAKILLNEYPRSPYASLAAFVLADEAIEKKDLEKAQSHLEWVLKNSKQTDFQSIARLRLMRLLIGQKKLDEALNLYNEKEAKGFLTLMAELKGDILLAKKDLDGARLAYGKAYEAAPEEAMHGPLLKMKMESLGLPVEKEATKS